MVDMGVALESSSFKFIITPGEFKNRAYTDSVLRSAVEGVDAVVAPKDMSTLKDVSVPGVLRVEKMRLDSVESILRSVKDGRNSEIYANSVIKTGRIEPKLVAFSQTFVQERKLLGLYNSKRLYKDFDFAGLSVHTSSIINYKGQEGRLVAFYLPPIVENIDKRELEIPLDNLRMRAIREESVILPTVNGNYEIKLGPVIRGAEAILENKSISTLRVLIDGAHRSFHMDMAGDETHVIDINGSDGGAPSMPIDINEVVMTSAKPAPDDRLLGRNEQAFRNLKWVAIDG